MMGLRNRTIVNLFAFSWGKELKTIDVKMIKLIVAVVVLGSMIWLDSSKYLSL